MNIRLKHAQKHIYHSIIQNLKHIERREFLCSVSVQHKGKGDICIEYVQAIDGVPITFYMCRTCQKSFTARKNLKRHHLIHTNQRDFLCKICQNTYTRKDALKKHMQSHGLIEEYFDYRCRICKKRLKSKECVRRHMISCHSEEIISNPS